MLTSSIAWMGWVLSFLSDACSFFSSAPVLLCTFLIFLRTVPLPLLKKMAISAVGLVDYIDKPVGMQVCRSVSVADEEDTSSRRGAKRASTLGIMVDEDYYRDLREVDSPWASLAKSSLPAGKR
jgi:hypothetical protein